MQWLKTDFLGYLKEWEDCVNAHTDVPDARRPMMLLSRETIEELYITGNNNNVYTVYGNLWLFMLAIQFIHSICLLNSRYLLSLPCSAGHYLLSKHFSQDPLENYLGQQRARGGYSHNPTMQACIASAQSLQVQGSMAVVSVQGNSSRKKRLFSKEVIDHTPLPKRPWHK